MQLSISVSSLNIELIPFDCVEYVKLNKNNWKSYNGIFNSKLYFELNEVNKWLAYSTH